MKWPLPNFCQASASSWHSRNFEAFWLPDLGARMSATKFHHDPDILWWVLHPATTQTTFVLCAIIWHGNIWKLVFWSSAGRSIQKNIRAYGAMVPCSSWSRYPHCSNPAPLAQIHIFWKKNKTCIFYKSKIDIYIYIYIDIYIYIRIYV